MDTKRLRTNTLICKILSLFFIFVIVTTSITPVFAKQTEEVENFYTIDQDALEELFSMTIDSTVKSLSNPIGWVTSGRTFVVVREYTDENGKTRYKVYVNTPDLAQYVRNLALKSVSDGWEDKMYVPESKLVSSVGENDDNVINKFGFNIPVNKYEGEYPIISMSLSGILPTKWYQKLWRGLKALVGLSFTEAPSKDNFKTLFYYNHEYTNSNDEQLVNFIQDYWLDYFVKPIWSDGDEYFRDAEDFRAQLITEEEINEAERFKDDYDKELKEIRKVEKEQQEWYEKYGEEESARQNNSEYRQEMEEWENDLLEKYSSRYDNIDDLYKDLNDGRLILDVESNSTKPVIHDYVDEPPQLTKQQQELQIKEVENEAVVERYKDFKDRWDRGKSKNDKLNDAAVGARHNGLNGISSSNSDAKFTYAQCLIDTSNEDDEDKELCRKTVDGQQVSGSMVDVFVSSGLYKIGLTKDSSKAVADFGGNGKLGKPVKKDGSIKDIVSGEDGKFGPRVAPTAGASTYHQGLDLAWGGCEGQPVVAAASGEVVEKVESNTGYGNSVVIKHDEKILTRYAHMVAGSISVEKGDKVTQGQQIGKIGNTGVGTGAHLHFEVIVDGNPNGKRVDPLKYLDSSIISGGSSSTPLKYKEDLSRREAIKILRSLQSKLGPVFTEVMENIIACCINNAALEGEEIQFEELIDTRVMPYDKSTLIPSGGGGISNNGSNVIISDPRVDIYKNENLIGGFISTGRINPSGILHNDGVSKLSINISGKLAQLSVFCNQVSNFEIIDNMGLSPTKMWSSVSYASITALIMVLLIINLVIFAFKYIKGQAGIGQILGRVILFLLYVTLVAFLTVYPEDTWNNYKKVFNELNNTGESVVINNMENVDELYGDSSDDSVTYYLPYFNLWTKYNTGYSIDSDEQLIDEDTPEAEDMWVPKIAGSETSLWPVVLADSFNSKGVNRSSTGLDGVNGPIPNLNAYRVVDHFIAPRLTVNSASQGHIDMENTTNENYNGQFQNMDIFSSLGGVASSINLLFISFIKMITFIWAWYVLYIFVFHILLGVADKRSGGVKSSLIRVLSPIISIALLGLYAGVIVQISILLDGVLGLFLNMCLIWFTFKLLSIWQEVYPNSFPAPLKYLAILGNIRKYKLNRQMRYLDDDMDYTLDVAGAKVNEDGTYDADFIDSEGNYIGTTEEQLNAYNSIMRKAQLQAQRDGNYNSISDERVAKHTESLDKINHVTPGMADNSARWLTNGQENTALIQQKGNSSSPSVNPSGLNSTKTPTESNRSSSNVSRPVSNAGNGSRENGLSSKDSRVNHTPSLNSRGDNEPRQKEKQKSKKNVGKSSKIEEEYLKDDNDKKSKKK